MMDGIGNYIKVGSPVSFDNKEFTIKAFHDLIPEDIYYYKRIEFNEPYHGLERPTELNVRLIKED